MNTWRLCLIKSDVSYRPHFYCHHKYWFLSLILFLALLCVILSLSHSHTCIEITINPMYGYICVCVRGRVCTTYASLIRLSLSLSPSLCPYVLISWPSKHTTQAHLLPSKARTRSHLQPTHTPAHYERQDTHTCSPWSVTPKQMTISVNETRAI